MPLAVSTLAALAALLASPVHKGQTSAVPPAMDMVVERVVLAPASMVRSIIPGLAVLDRADRPVRIAAAVWALSFLNGRFLAREGEEVVAGSGVRDLIFRNRALAPIAAFPRRGIIAGLAMRF